MNISRPSLSVTPRRGLRKVEKKEDVSLMRLVTHNLRRDTIFRSLKKASSHRAVWNAATPARGSFHSPFNISLFLMSSPIFRERNEERFITRPQPPVNASSSSYASSVVVVVVVVVPPSIAFTTLNLQLARGQLSPRLFSKHLVEPT